MILSPSTPNANRGSALATSRPRRFGVPSLLLVAALVFAATPGCGGSDAPNPAADYGDAVAALIDEALESGNSFSMLSDLCRTAPHRLSGSADAAAAVDWARRTMMEIGLENVRIEDVMVPHWERGDVESLDILSPTTPDPTLRVLALGGSVGTPPGGIEAEVVEVRSFEELEDLGEAARGKIIFFNRPMDPTQRNTFAAYGGSVGQRSRGATEAARAGGVAALVRSMTTRLDDAPHTGAMRPYADDLPRVPAAAVSTLGAERLSSLLAARGPVRLRLELGCRTLPEAPSHNVVGEIIGRELPSEVVVVGGHLDCWDVGQGAHDDGSGCIHSLEAARLLLATGFRPRRTVRVVMFMNEENGVRGGNAYYERYVGDMERHVMALESDRGGFVPRGFTTDANPEALGVLRQAAVHLEPIFASQVMRGGGGVDISPMAAGGVPLVGLLPDSQRYFDFHHSENDTIDAVHPRELALGSAAVAALVGIVADLPEALPRNEPK